MTERTLSATRLRLAVRERLRLLVFGSLTGVLAGMGSFMFIKAQYMPWGLGKAWALALVAVAGVYTHLLARDLAESVGLSLVAVAVGLTFHTVAWISPLWILSYPPFARGLLLPKMVGQALMSGVFGYLGTFYASYFTAILVAGYLDP